MKKVVLIQFQFRQNLNWILLYRMLSRICSLWELFCVDCRPQIRAASGQWRCRGTWWPWRPQSEQDWGPDPLVCHSARLVARGLRTGSEKEYSISWWRKYLLGTGETQMQWRQSVGRSSSWRVCPVWRGPRRWSCSAGSPCSDPPAACSLHSPPGPAAAVCRAARWRRGSWWRPSTPAAGRCTGQSGGRTRTERHGQLCTF